MGSVVSISRERLWSRIRHRTLQHRPTSFIRSDPATYTTPPSLLPSLPHLRQTHHHGYWCRKTSWRLQRSAPPLCVGQTGSRCLYDVGPGREGLAGSMRAGRNGQAPLSRCAVLSSQRFSCRQQHSDGEEQRNLLSLVK